MNDELYFFLFKQRGGDLHLLSKEARFVLLITSHRIKMKETCQSIFETDNVNKRGNIFY